MKATYIDHMGTDLSVVNAARVSFGKTSNWEKGWDYKEQRPVLSPADKSLIAFLARGCTSGDWEGVEAMVYDHCLSGSNGDEDALLKELPDLLNHIRKMPSHWTPFGHTAISLHLKVPIFVARQIMKHQAGFVVNEVSRRYVTDEPEFYVPEVWRKAAENVKQGSLDESVDYITMPSNMPAQAMENMVGVYNRMLDEGICAEQARMVLPQSMYTEFWMTGNLYGWANLFNQRSDSHAQRETQEVAKQIGEIIEPLFPESWKELTK